jgi:hypothetical protein
MLALNRYQIINIDFDKTPITISTHVLKKIQENLFYHPIEG